MIETINSIVTTYGLVKKGDKFVGKCPKCGGSETTDRFNIREDGGFKCYSCEFKGDIITWLREMEGKSCPEAHVAAGVECKPGASCRAWDTCRLGSGKGEAGAKRGVARPRPVTVPPEKAAPTLARAREGAPDPRWQTWAEGLVSQAMAALPENKAVNTWLVSRGIDQAAAQRFRLGWLQRDIKVDRASIGLDPMKKGKSTLWVPSGLLIPIYDLEGRIHRLRVRRPGWARQKFLPELKYVWLDGSGFEPMVIVPAGQPRGAVIVEAELDAMACAAAHGEVLVVALGTVRGGLTGQLRELLAASPVIMVALDAEPGKDGKPGPGPEAVAVWLRQYRQAKFWPVPAGKDPGDYVKEHGGNLQLWLEAGLPPALCPSHDPMSSPDCTTTGGGGTATVVNKVENAAAEIGVYPVECDPELLELLEIMQHQQAYLLVQWHGRELGFWFPPPLDMYNRVERHRANDILYSGRQVPALVGLLPAGRWDKIRLARFAGIKD